MTPDQKTEIEMAIRRDEKMLVRWLTRKLGDADAAHDVAQNVYLRVWAFAEHSEVENPRALIFKAASNLACNELRRRNKFDRRHLRTMPFSDNDPLENIVSTGPSPEKQATLKQDVEIVLRAIRELPDRPRRAFEMSRFDGLSYKEIAARMNVSESSVEKYMIEALKKLRVAVHDQQKSDEKIVQFPKERGQRKRT